MSFLVEGVNSTIYIYIYTHVWEVLRLGLRSPDDFRQVMPHLGSLPAIIPKTDGERAASGGSAAGGCLGVLRGALGVLRGAAALRNGMLLASTGPEMEKQVKTNSNFWLLNSFFFSGGFLKAGSFRHPKSSSGHSAKTRRPSGWLLAHVDGPQVPF